MQANNGQCERFFKKGKEGKVKGLKTKILIGTLGHGIFHVLFSYHFFVYKGKRKIFGNSFTLLFTISKV
jgi:hypothetical protein